MALNCSDEWVDYYEILGLEDGCEGYAGVAAAYGAVEHAYHTTKSSLLDHLAAAGDEYHLIALALEKVEWAHDVLSNPALRDKYDSAYFGMLSDLINATVDRLEEAARRKRLRSMEGKEIVGMNPQRIKEFGRLVAKKMYSAGQVGPVMKMEGAVKRVFDYISNDTN